MTPTDTSGPDGAQVAGSPVVQVWTLRLKRSASSSVSRALPNVSRAKIFTSASLSITPCVSPAPPAEHIIGSVGAGFTCGHGATRTLRATVRTVRATVRTLRASRWTLRATQWTLRATVWTVRTTAWTIRATVWTLRATGWTLRAAVRMDAFGFGAYQHGEEFPVLPGGVAEGSDGGLQAHGELAQVVNAVQRDAQRVQPGRVLAVGDEVVSPPHVGHHPSRLHHARLRPGRVHLRGAADAKGYGVDAKGYGVDAKGYMVDGKGYMVDAKGYIVKGYRATMWMLRATLWMLRATVWKATGLPCGC
eukprot:6573180-Pyramimonas_sp.AAC.2